MMIEVAEISVLYYYLELVWMEGEEKWVKRRWWGFNRPYMDIGERFKGIWSLFYPFKPLSFFFFFFFLRVKPLSFNCPKLWEFGMGEKRRGYTYIQNFNFSIDYALIMSFYLFFEVEKKYHNFQFIQPFPSSLLPYLIFKTSK